MTCIFCNIVTGKIPASIVLDDTDIMAFRDIHPQAPTHLLVIPKHHIATINDTNNADQALLGKMLLAGKNLAALEGLSSSGYRLVFNINAGGGQDVYHIHLHVLGGRQMQWPPG